MLGRGKTFELLDFPKFASPSVLQMDASRTATNLIDRLGGKSFMSYSQIWSQMPSIVGGFASEPFICREFDSYSDGWKNDSIRDAVRLLRSHFGGRGKWYPFRKRGKTRGIGMIIRFPRRRESDSLWACRRLPTSMAFQTPI